MKKQVSPAVVALLVVVIIGGLGFVIWKAVQSTGGDTGTAMVVKPNDPNDPKYRPDPRLGLAGGGGGGGGATQSSNATGSKAAFLGSQGGQASSGGGQNLGNSSD